MDSSNSSAVGENNDMTEDEVNRMVQEALQRARRAMMSRTSRNDDSNAPVITPSGSHYSNNQLSAFSRSVSHDESDASMRGESVQNKPNISKHEGENVATSTLNISAKLEALRKAMSYDSSISQGNAYLGNSSVASNSIPENNSFTNEPDQTPVSGSLSIKVSSKFSKEYEALDNEDQGKISTKYSSKTVSKEYSVETAFSKEKTKAMAEDIDQMYRTAMMSNDTNNTSVESNYDSEPEESNSYHLYVDTLPDNTLPTTLSSNVQEDDLLDNKYNDLEEEALLLRTQGGSIIKTEHMQHSLPQNPSSMIEESSYESQKEDYGISNESYEDDYIQSDLDKLKSRNEILLGRMNASSIIEMAEREAKEALLIAQQYKEQSKLDEASFEDRHQHQHLGETPSNDVVSVNTSSVSEIEQEVQRVTQEVNQLVLNARKSSSASLSDEVVGEIRNINAAPTIAATIQQVSQGAFVDDSLGSVENSEYTEHIDNKSYTTGNEEDSTYLEKEESPRDMTGNSNNIYDDRKAETNDSQKENVSEEDDFYDSQVGGYLDDNEEEENLYNGEVSENLKEDQDTVTLKENEDVDAGKCMNYSYQSTTVSGKKETFTSVEDYTSHTIGIDSYEEKIYTKEEEYYYQDSTDNSYNESSQKKYTEFQSDTEHENEQDSFSENDRYKESPSSDYEVPSVPLYSNTESLDEEIAVHNSKEEVEKGAVDDNSSISSADNDDYTDETVSDNEELQDQDDGKYHGMDEDNSLTPEEEAGIEKVQVSSTSQENRQIQVISVSDEVRNQENINRTNSSPTRSTNSAEITTEAFKKSEVFFPEQDNISDYTSESKSKHARHNPRQIELRNPYPLPPPAIRPRSPNTIIQEHLKPLSPISMKWLKPSVQLAELLCAAKGDSVARRSNACGALKVLAARKENQKKLARTGGVLEALVFAANQSPTSGNSDNAFDARTRAVATILYLSSPVSNRTLILSHPGLAQCLVKVMDEDYGEARVNACSALALLAKTQENRGFMVEVPNLIKTVSEVISGQRRYEAKQGNGVKQRDLSDDDLSVGSGSTYDDNSASDSDNDSYSHDESGSQSYSYVTGRGEQAYDGANTKEKKDSKKSTEKSLNGKIIYDVRPIHLKKCAEYLDAARLNSCAILTHLVKYCPVSNSLSSTKVMIDTLIKVSIEFPSPVHTRCIEIICHLTRFQSNNTNLAQNNDLVETLISCGRSKEPEDRLWSLRALQNLASDPKSKLHLATTALLTLLSVSAMRKVEDEQLAAIGALLNLSTESANIVPLTNTKSVLATLVHLAHYPSSSFDVRRMACNTLSNISLWLQTLASKGSVPEGFDKVLLPSNEASGWQRWD